MDYLAVFFGMEYLVDIVGDYDVIAAFGYLRTVVGIRHCVLLLAGCCLLAIFSLFRLDIDIDAYVIDGIGRSHIVRSQHYLKGICYLEIALVYIYLNRVVQSVGAGLIIEMSIYIAALRHYRGSRLYDVGQPSYRVYITRVSRYGSHCVVYTALVALCGDGEHILARLSYIQRRYLACGSCLG